MLACQSLGSTELARSAAVRVEFTNNLHSHDVPMIKLTRRQTKEALSSVPLDALLMGAQGAKATPLTAKQRRFAEGVAMGKTGAQAYRDAYDSNGLPVTESHEGSRLKANPLVAAQIQALALAQEAQRHSTPAALRALVIQKLTEHAISDDVQPAQRLRALELLGKVTEIAAFTERREIVKTTDAGQARTQLLDSLRSALKLGAVDAAMTLTAQATTGSFPGIDSQASMPVPITIDALPDDGPHAFEAAAGADPATRAPLDQPLGPASTLLSNPLIQSPHPDEPPVASSNNEEGRGVNFQDSGL